VYAQAEDPAEAEGVAVQPSGLAMAAGKQPGARGKEKFNTQPGQTQQEAEGMATDVAQHAY
jgi:hypothetical protein